jgi:hypothetical protein
MLECRHWSRRASVYGEGAGGLDVHMSDQVESKHKVCNSVCEMGRNVPMAVALAVPAEDFLQPRPVGRSLDYKKTTQP